MDNISTDSLAEGVLFIVGSLLAIVVLVMVIRTKSSQVDTLHTPQSSGNQNNHITVANIENTLPATPTVNPEEIV